MYKFRILLGALLLTSQTTVFGQGAKNIVINEVLTNNTQSIVDEFGQRQPWIELENTSFSTYNVRGMYITTDRAVLDKQMSAPERIKRMSIIPSGDDRTAIGARKHLLLFCNGQPSDGKLHLAVSIPMSEPVWVALYNGNGVELIDSVTVPPLAADESYARSGKGWQAKPADAVTPGIENFIEAAESKIDKFKRQDPHGFAMAIMAMGTVFFCLALLWVFFTIFGNVMRKVEAKKNRQLSKPVAKTTGAVRDLSRHAGDTKDGSEKEDIDMNLYLAVIGMALKQYEDDVHDVESGVITIKPKDTEWDDEYSQMTQFREGIIPSSHTAPNIPKNPEL